MNRISDERFLKMKYNADNIVGIRIKDGEFYFIGWMENADNYKIQMPENGNGLLLSRDSIMFDGNLYDAIITADGYNNMLYLYETDDDGHLIHENEKIFPDAYAEFLTLIDCYTRDGKTEDDDHDIFITTKEEFSNVCDALRDGDYIFIFSDGIH